MLNLRPGDELGERKKIARLETRQESKKDDWKTLAHGLCGGGLALLLRGDTKAGCLLWWAQHASHCTTPLSEKILSAAAGLLKYEGWAGPKDWQENNSKTAEEFNKIREGPKPLKGKSWSDTAEGVTRTSTPYFGKCDLVEVGGSAPGLRAFRMNPGRTGEKPWDARCIICRRAVHLTRRKDPLPCRIWSE